MDSTQTINYLDLFRQDGIRGSSRDTDIQQRDAMRRIREMAEWEDAVGIAIVDGLDGAVQEVAVQRRRSLCRASSTGQTRFLASEGPSRVLSPETATAPWAIV
jgi:hypothetical protein